MAAERSSAKRDIAEDRRRRGEPPRKWESRVFWGGAVSAALVEMDVFW